MIFHFINLVTNVLHLNTNYTMWAKSQQMARDKVFKLHKEDVVIKQSGLALHWLVYGAYKEYS